MRPLPHDALRASLVAVPLLALVHLGLGSALPPGAELSQLDSLSPWVATQALARILGTIGLTVSLVLGPGLLLRRWLPALGPAYVWIPGLLLLAATGGACWALADRVNPQITATIVLAPVLVVLVGAAVRQRDGRSWFVPGETAATGLLLLLVALGTAKATWSSGPERELYGDTVSRTLEPGDRSDSRISFHVVQLVNHGLHPTSRTAKGYFAPYSFSDRGPIAGLAAAPVVVGSGAEPPLAMPDQPWSPYDREGFAAYRIALEVFAATLVLSVFGLLSAFFPRRIAWAGTVLVGSTPFVVHEVYFTWPKLLAASFGIAALTAALTRRPLVAGALLGLSYLAHPVGFFVTIAVVGVWFGYEWRRLELRRLVLSGAGIAVGVVVCSLAWRLVNAGEFHQTDRFGEYLFTANSVRPVPLAQWFESRLRSLGNTVVPFEMVAVDRDEAHLTTLSWPALWFDYQYWNTLPFAVGLCYFPLFVAGLVRYARAHAAIALWGIAVPFLVFVLYWGSFVTGLMREGLQGWIVIALLAAFLGHGIDNRLVRAALTLRAAEVLLLLLAAPLLDDGLLGPDPTVITDIASLATMVGGTALLALLTWRAFAPNSRSKQIDDVAVDGGKPPVEGRKPPALLSS